MLWCSEFRWMGSRDGKATARKASDQMVQYYQNNKARLARELIWLGIVLRRAKMVPLEDQSVIEERLNMYDDLFENDPKMQRLRAEWEARGKMEGEAEGEVKGEVTALRKVIVKTIKKRFPTLAGLAQQRVKKITALDELDALFDKIIIITDEQAAHEILDALPV